MSTTTDLDPADSPLTPLTPLDVMPLHPADHLCDGERFACQGVGARSASTRYDWRCPDCVDCARLDVAAVGDWVASWRYGPDDHPRQVSMSWMLRRADHWAGT